jgi:catechol 2,3-dioxygenase-like lactoylglutathione lyase family enzyme
MSDALTRLFNDFDRGRISRRRLLQALGMAAAIRPMSAFAQGQCGGARAGTPECDPTPAKLPFEPTGWKTVYLDYFSMQVADYEKEAAYFAALMNWKIRSNDGKEALLDIGEWGGILIRGGYQPPPTAPTPPAEPPAAAAGAAGAAGATGVAGAGRGGGRGGGGGGQRAPRLATFDAACWGIEPWNAKTVEAELKKRGLNPVADNRAGGFESFRIKDADGFDLRISNGNRKNRRARPANGKVNAPAPFEPTNWKTLFLDHISFETTNYKEQAAFYHALLGWKLGQDEGSQNEVKIGDFGGAIIRRGGGGGRATAAGAGAPATPPVRRVNFGHIAFGISPWDADAVKAELDKRGLSARVDMGGPPNTLEAMRTAKYQSYHTTTPNGYDLQISNTVA